jgi:Domain of unknown function (DUF4380)
MEMSVLGQCSFVWRRDAFLALAVLYATPAVAAGHCSIRPMNYKGWNAEEIRNEWVRLTFVPQLGGRLMQVAFGQHQYLFVNKRYEGQYLPPLAPDAPPTWYNYGGDKIWPLPEGRKDEKHWPGPLADPLDDGDYAFSILSQGAECKVRLDGPPDPRTGLRYSREIGLAADSPEISFHAVMKNASARPIEWSVQSVTQYSTADRSGQKASADIWAFAAANEHSSYSDGYFVRSGNAPTGLSMKNVLVTLNCSSRESELWFDTQAGWLAVADSATQYVMVERFRVESGKEYPGKATVIFYTNDGNDPAEAGLYYMEAEINSPMVRLEPGETYQMDTEWFPTRAGKDFLAVTDAGVIRDHLRISSETKTQKLTGAFGVFYPGKIVAKFLDKDGKQVAEVKLKSVTPQEPTKLNERIKVPKGASRVALQLVGFQGQLHGVLDDISIESRGGA